MQIAKDSFVVIEYSLRLDDGSFVKGENTPASMNFIAGYGQILCGPGKWNSSVLSRGGKKN